MLKKGEMNSEFQLRWCMLSDEEEGPMLRYYEGRNTVTRVFKGQIMINPTDVLSVRSFTHTAGEYLSPACTAQRTRQLDLRART